MCPKQLFTRAGALALVPLLAAAVAPRPAVPPAVVQYSTDAAHLLLHAVAVTRAGGHPHVLMSESQERFATGSRTVRVARASGDVSGSEQKELEVMARMGPLASLAVSASGQYGLAVTDETGLRFSVHAKEGQELAAAKPIPDQVPMAVFPHSEDYVVVGNRGYFVFDADGTLLRQLAVPTGSYVAAALWAGDRRCALLSVVVDPGSQIWKLQQHCVEPDGITLHRSVDGAVQAQPSHLFWMDLDPGSRLQVVLTAPSVEQDGRWVLLRCALERKTGCTSRPLADIPANPVLALRGLPVVALNASTVAVLAPTPDAQALWIGKFSSGGGPPRATRSLALPAASARSVALLEGLSVTRSGRDVWVALAYAQPNALDSVARSGYRTAVTVHRLSAAQLFETRR